VVTVGGSTAPRHIPPEEAGQQSRDAQSAFVGGGHIGTILSASRFAAANEGSSHRRHPLLWVAGFFGVLAVGTALLILFVR
jgi:hypothetical protein